MCFISLDKPATKVTSVAPLLPCFFEAAITAWPNGVSPAMEGNPPKPIDRIELYCDAWYAGLLDGFSRVVIL